MNILEKYGFDKDEIQEYIDNTPPKMQNLLEKHLPLVEVN